MPHGLCSLVPTSSGPSSTHSEGLWQQNPSSIPLGDLSNSRARAACALPYRLHQPLREPEHGPAGGQEGILKGPGFHCTWEGRQGGCYKGGR